MTKDYQIYLVDDDPDLRESTLELLAHEKLTAQGFDAGARMLKLLDPEWGGVILCDVRMAGMDGFQVLEAAKAIAPEVPFIMITGHGDVRTAISAIKRGAYDFLEKPVLPEHLISLLRRSLRARQLVQENRRLRRRMARGGDMRARLIGRSEAMKTCRRALMNVAPLPLSVLIHGEAGTGKELAARCLHDFSDQTGDFVLVPCASLAPGDLMPRLYEGSIEAPPLLEQARGGSLFLRDVDRLDERDQIRLADLLALGDRPRIIASAKGDPVAALDEGALIEDLYYRLGVARIEMPPLRARDKDMFQLLELFLRDTAARFHRKLPLVTKETLAPFYNHDWPGNVRELRNVAERLVIGLPPQLERRRPLGGAAETADYDSAMAAFERQLLENALMQTGGRKSEAAALLSIPRKRLYLRMKAVGLSQAGQE